MEFTSAAAFFFFVYVYFKRLTFELYLKRKSILQIICLINTNEFVKFLILLFFAH